MSSFACGSIHQGLDPERLSDESRGRRKIYMYLAAAFDDSRIDGGAKIYMDQILLHEDSFFLCAFNRSDVQGKNSSLFEVNCRL